MKINIASKEVIHFIGVGGIGMSGLAQIMKNMGFVIQGSDLSRNKNTDRLIKSGIKFADCFISDSKYLTFLNLLFIITIFFIKKNIILKISNEIL